MPALWQVSGREKRQDIGGVFSMTKNSEKCLHPYGYKVLYHMYYETITVSCSQCGDTITYDYPEREEPDLAKLGQQRAEEREGYDDR
jgi:hypothetical protein